MAKLPKTTYPPNNSDLLNNKIITLLKIMIFGVLISSSGIINFEVNPNPSSPRGRKGVNHKIIHRIPGARNPLATLEKLDIAWFF